MEATATQLENELHSLRAELDAAAETFVATAEKFIAQGSDSYTIAMCKLLSVAERLRFPDATDRRGGLALGFKWMLSRSKDTDRGDFPAA